MKIFRKLRQQFISKKNVRRYLLYSFGEIMLVVIGIILALQIDGCYKDSENRKIESTYLEGILLELNQDIDNLNRTLARDTMLFDSYTTVLKAFTNPAIKSNDSVLANALTNAQGINLFNERSVVFQDMKSSGRINLIRSDSLRFSILEYYNASAKLVDFESDQNQLILDHKTAAFYPNNLDMNSLFEQTKFFPEEWVAEVDPLDLSFFDRDLKDSKVISFANRVSSQKGTLLFNHIGRRKLLDMAEKLKNRISNHLPLEDSATMMTSH